MASLRGLGLGLGLSRGLSRPLLLPASFIPARLLSTSTALAAKYKSPKKRPSVYAKPEFADSKSAVPSRVIVPSNAAAAKPAPKSAPSAKISPLPRPPATPTPKSTPTPPFTPRSTFAEQLGLRSAPTLLYEAPSHTWYRFLTTSLGVTFITYSVLNYWDIYLHAPKDILWWVPYAFAGICAFMAAFGAYMFRGTHGIVRSIQAVPSALLKGGAAETAAAAQAPILLELKVSRMIPVLPARTRYVLPGELTLPARLASAGLSESATGAFGATPQIPESLKDRVLSRRAEEERKRQAREYEMNHLMTAPFRHAGQGASTAWKHVMRAFSHEGFMRATEAATGKRHKIDITGGWALDNGRALDRLVKVFDDE